MSKFVIIYSKKDKGSEELDSDHQEFLIEMQHREKVLISGSLADQDQFLLIIEEESKEKAFNIIYRDPYIQTGHYKTFKLTELI